MDYFLESVKLESNMDRLFNILSNEESRLSPEVLTESFNAEKVTMVAKRIAEVVKRLIAKMKDMMNVFQKHVEESIKKYEAKKRLKAIKEAANKLQDVEVIDVWKLEELFDKTMKETSRIYKQWMRVSKEATTYKDGVALSKRVVAINNKYRKRVEEIQRKKIKVPATKLIAYLEKNLDSDYIYTPYKEFIKTMEQYMETLNDVMARTEKYAKENDFVIFPHGFSDHLHNTISYIKQNRDWIFSYAISNLITLYSSVSTIKDMKKNIQKGIEAAIQNPSDDFATNYKTIQSAMANNKSKSKKAVDSVLNLAATEELIRGAINMKKASKNGRFDI